jgi:hypothetical protein
MSLFKGRRIIDDEFALGIERAVFSPNRADEPGAERGIDKVGITSLHGKFQMRATCGKTVGDNMTYEDEEDEG